MDDLMMTMYFMGSVLVLGVMAFIVYKGMSPSKAEEEDASDGSTKRPKKVLPPVDTEGPRRKKVPPKPQKKSDDEATYYEEELNEMYSEEELSKMGAKKRAKLEAKAEKRHQREIEILDREDKKQQEMERQLERLKKEDEEKKLEEKENLRLEQEKAAKEAKELEEYLAMKATFSIAEEGYEEDGEGDESSGPNKLQQFVQYIKDQKVVLMEDLAGHFKMRTQDVISRINDLIADESIVGVIDDRGKFIYIHPEELKEVAKFIKQRGRVSITDLVQSSNSLINLTPVEA